MKALRLPLAILFFVGALAFAYFYVTHSPWFGHPETSGVGPPKAPPGAGPTPEQMKRWADRQKQTPPGESKKGGQ